MAFSRLVRPALSRDQWQVGFVTGLALGRPDGVDFRHRHLGEFPAPERRLEVEPNRVRVVVLRALGDTAREVDAQPAVEELRDADPVI
ncbi:MAG: hypothetical protein WAV54_01315 [Acidimicrobiales bacterium]